MHTHCTLHTNGELFDSSINVVHTVLGIGDEGDQMRKKKMRRKKYH